MSDEKRIKFAVLGDDLLVEKKTGYRIGLYRIRRVASKYDGTGVKLGFPNVSKMYVIGSTDCDFLNSVNVLKNTAEFIFFNWECQSTNKDGTREQVYLYYNFDKRYSRLDHIAHADYQKNQPTLTLTKGVYKFRWLDYKQSDGSANPIFYDFKVTGNRPSDLKCSRTWNDECDLSLQDDPLPPNQYKILDE